MNELQEKYREQIEQLIDACHRVAELNYVTSSGGNLSIRVDENIMLITPSKTLKRRMRIEDICIIDLEGNILFAPEGKKPTGEWPFHTAIMRKRTDITAIAHAHPPVLTGYAIAKTGQMELPILPEPIIETGPILTVKYATPLSQELSDNFMEIIDQSNGFLMENHGVLFVSQHGIEDAVELMNMTECMAQSALVAQVLGNMEPMTAKAVKEMDEVIRIRNLNVPGAKGKYASAYELYKLEQLS